MYWLHRSQPVAVNRQHITMTLGHFQKQPLFPPMCNSNSDIFPALFFCKHFLSPQRRTGTPSLSPASWWAERWNSPSMKSRSNQQVTRAYGRSSVCRVGRGSGWTLFSVFSLVVGVKLNVSFWMNSFMNATLKQNVSPVKGWVAAFCLS